MKTLKHITPAICRANPTTIFVFGDNLKGYGKGGQAIIRDEPNSFGIPTKREPSWAPTAFFRDRPNESKAVNIAIRKLVDLKNQGNPIVFPTDGIGTGMAKMKQKSPKLFEHMNNLLDKYFN